LVGFFGSGRPASCLAERITQPTSGWLILFEPTLSAIDAANLKRFVLLLSTPFFGAIPGSESIRGDISNSLWDWRLQTNKNKETGFPHHFAQLEKKI
jgi:hypothetical protein